MPVRNGKKWLPAALTSIKKQTLTDWELVVVDDASEDGSAELVRKYMGARATIIRSETHLGPGKARNLGWRMCRGKYIAAMDCDETMHPRRLEAQVTALEAEPTATLAYCNHLEIHHKTGKKIPRTTPPPEQLPTHLVIHNPIHQAAFMLRRKHLPEPPYPEWYYAEDYWLLTRLITKGKNLVKVEKMLVTRGLHPTSAIHTYGKNQKFDRYRDIFAAYLPAILSTQIDQHQLILHTALATTTPRYPPAEILHWCQTLLELTEPAPTIHFPLLRKLLKIKLLTYMHHSTPRKAKTLLKYLTSPLAYREKPLSLLSLTIKYLTG